MYNFLFIIDIDIKTNRIFNTMFLEKGTNFI